jgi:hypothetical protein
VTFAKLTEALAQLRKLLSGHVPGSLGEVNVATPRRDDDELAFLRLIVWCYSVVQEAGRVPLRFLKELPPFKSGRLLPEVELLRTWATHNLKLDSDSDQDKQKRALLWLNQTCGTSAPESAAHWKACFDRLSDSVGSVLEQAREAAGLLSAPEDGPRLVTELKKRVERDWEAYRFDEPVAASIGRLGFHGLDPVAFRKLRVEEWRKVVKTADDGAIDRLLVLRIQADLLHFMNEALPLTARDAIERFALETPGQVGTFMLTLRAAASRAKPAATALELIDRLSDELDGPQVE